MPGTLGAPPRLRGIRVLVAEPELAEGLPASEIEAATQALVAPIVDLEPGGERLLDAEPDPARGLLGLLVLHGMLLREVELPGTAHAELVGEGDLILPGGSEAGSGGCTIGWGGGTPTPPPTLHKA